MMAATTIVLVSIFVVILLVLAYKAEQLESDEEE